MTRPRSDSTKRHTSDGRRPKRVPRLPTSAVLRTETTDETQGFMKALVAGSDDRILGFTMIGAEGGEVMAVVQTAMLADLPYPKLRDAILAHPTMAAPRLAVRECAAARCPTGHTKTDRPALMVRSRSDVRAPYSLAEGGWAIGRMRVGVGLNFIVLAALGSLGPASLEGIRP